MNIAVNTRLLLPGKLSGIGRFTCETLRIITRSHPEHTFFFFFDRNYASEFIFADNVRPVILPPQSRHPVLWYIWFEISVKRALKKYKIDLFLSPDGYLPLAVDIPCIPVIHDINFAHYPAFLPPLARKYFNHFFPRYAREASKIATVSQFSKTDIAKTYAIDSAKIQVVYNGVSEVFKTPGDSRKTKLKQSYTSGKDFFIFVGDLHPRKNIERILQAFDLFKTESLSDIKFVIVGSPMCKTKTIKRTFHSMRHQKDVVFTGRLPDEELSGLMAEAMAMVYVSIFEGFGIPIVEAMYSEIPVICSKRDAQAEIAGDAALLVDPLSVEDIKQGMHTIVDDETLCRRLVAAGNLRKKEFTWEKTAQALWNTIESCL